MFVFGQFAAVGVSGVIGLSSIVEPRLSNSAGISASKTLMDGSEDVGYGSEDFVEVIWLGA